MTTLHITENRGDGSTLLCTGEKDRRTRRQLAEGTAFRAVSRFFAHNVLNDPELCADCREIHEGLPAPKTPAVLRPQPAQPDAWVRVEGRASRVVTLADRKAEVQDAMHGKLRKQMKRISDRRDGSTLEFLDGRVVEFRPATEDDLNA